MKLLMLRANKGWSQSDLAKEAEVQQGTISRIEKGETKDYSVKTMFRIAQALGVKVTDIDEFANRLEGKVGLQAVLSRLEATSAGLIVHSY